MLTYDCQYKEQRNNPSEKVGAFAEVVDREDGQYLIACIAVASGPIAIGDAAINTCIHQFENMSKDEMLYCPEFIKEYKARVTAIIEQLNKTIFDAGQRLQIHPLMSITAVAIDPNGQSSFCQIGNTIAVLCNEGKTFMATQPMTTEKDFQKAGIQTFPVDKNTVTALGINHTTFPKFTKTVVNDKTSVFLLSSGFSIDLRRTIDVISKTQAKAALPEILIKSISKSRGLACADAVLSIHPSEKQ
ncbi:MAG: hypothetical protein II038_10935 [Lachnospiraceae bacterium]|nr:hypothetical protein [Lachnospiraceae bacterium]